MNKTKLTALLLACMLVVLALAGCSGNSKDGTAGPDGTVVVGAKNYTEALFTSEIMAQLIENKTDLKVERKFNLASAVCFEGVKNGDIDMFPEYTGGGLLNYLKQDPVGSPEETYDKVKEGYEKEFGLIWLKQMGFNNTFANAVSREFSEQYGVTKNSELAQYTPDLVYGAAHGFYDRPDGFYNMCETYGYNFKDIYKCDVSMIYQAFGQGDLMDVASIYTTDGLLSEYDLVVLEDDLGYFPAYYCAPVVRKATLEKYPELEEVLNLLENCTTEEEMIRYNYLIDTKKMTLEGAAEEFLKEKGLID